MHTQRPSPTAADYLVITLSPLLIMLMVGSLCYFLISLFFHGETIGGVRWVMFWFVLAIVAVARIGIEQGRSRAAIYGAGLAVATWLYLLTVHPAYLLGMFLLGVVWWAAHKLVWDCTLVDESEDASGSGLLATEDSLVSPKAWMQKIRASSRQLKISPATEPTPHTPGIWVVYFSLIALPVFGLGQRLLPDNDPLKQQAGFKYLLVYLAAAFGLLLTTSFLGLRRYLRQRYLAMPASIAAGWLRLGVGVAVFVLVGALLLPRPGVGAAWNGLRGEVDHTLQRASDYALSFSPHGQGPGRESTAPSQLSDPNQPPQNAAQDPKPSNSGTPEPGQSSAPDKHPSLGNFDETVQSPIPGSNLRPLKFLFWTFVLILAGIWLYRKRDLLSQLWESLLAAIQQFVQNLGGLRLPGTKPVETHPSPALQPFAAFQNPFLTGKERIWSQVELIRYGAAAMRAWATERGAPPRDEQTFREFCRDLAVRYPELQGDLEGFARSYSRTAYGKMEGDGAELEPLRNLWRFWGEELAASSRK